MTEKELKKRLSDIAKETTAFWEAQQEIVTPQTPTIYLTFDDGPSIYTAQLLDVLGRHNVKATFFVTLQDPENLDMVGCAYREGHTIGVHSASHDFRTIYANEASFYQDFLSCEEMIFAQTGQYSTLFRFPGGSSNTISRHWCAGIMTRLAASMTEMGYQYFDWNVDSGDCFHAQEPEEVFRNIVDSCQSRIVCVVLQHDIKSYSVEAVESTILWGEENGFRFLPLRRTSPTARHSIAN